MPNLQWRTHPRKYGRDSRACRHTGDNHGLIRKYDLYIARRSFREIAEVVGFTKTR